MPFTSSVDRVHPFYFCHGAALDDGTVSCIIGESHIATLLK
ncbi:hypothetical protein [Myxococcus guangdongensis]|nr:hypothetical protein [Myxococcus guangdongensis]